MITDKTEQEMHKEFYNQIFQTLDQEPFAQFLGMKLTEMGEGTATAEIDIKKHMLNSHGTVHGAIIFSLADYVFAAASNSYGKTSVGLSTNVNFMAPAKKVLRLQPLQQKQKGITGLHGITFGWKVMEN